jgi:hypothetical protein
MFQAPLQTLSWFDIPLADLDQVERLHRALHEAPPAEQAPSARQFTDREGHCIGWPALQ